MEAPRRERRDGPEEERLYGFIERVTFHNPENGYTVLRVRVRGQRNPVAVVGKLPSAVPGEMLEASGRWEFNPRHGRQFSAVRLSAAPPGTSAGMKRYLGSGMIRGIGPALAARLVEAFGADVFRVIEETPARLSEVPGIGAERRKAIVAAWADQRRVREIMVFLHSHGVSTGRALSIFKTYGETAVESIRDDPYRLARDIRGIGFLLADRIATSIGIAPDSEIRVRSGLEHVLLEMTEQGDCAALREVLCARAAELLKVPAPLAEQALEANIRSGRLRARRDGEGRDLVYLPGLEEAERRLAERIVRLAAGAHPCPGVAADRALAWVEGKTGIELSAGQREAVRRALEKPVSVVTGGPGVGKTTLVDSLVKIFTAKGLKVALCAPTGRAAKRLTESTGFPARTIHRLLEYDPARGEFTRNPTRPLAADAVIVDEFSMVDLLLAWHLVRAVPERALLILVGDVDQLPSVGPGTVLRDLIASEVVPVTRLRLVFRQAEGSAIVTNAHRINLGRLPLIPRGPAAAGDFVFVECADPAAAADRICELVARRIPRRFGLDPIRDIQVLSPMKRGELGVGNLNRLLQEALNPGEGGIASLGVRYRPGDRVMQTENDYDRDVFNGDVGRILEIDSDLARVAVDFDGRAVVYESRDLEELSLSYAVSIHKSQGSEYPAVVIPIHPQHYVMLQRNLLYTALTRARSLAVVVGTKDALALAVRRRDSHRRLTTLRERLAETAPPPPPPRFVDFFAGEKGG